MYTMHNHGKSKVMQDLDTLTKLSGIEVSELEEVVNEGIEESSEQDIANKNGKQSLSHIDTNWIQFDQLRIFIQPIYSLQENRAIGAEALIRCQDTSLTADKIIQNMVDTKRTRELDLQIIETICENKLWRKLGIARININLSADTLNTDGLWADIADILKRHRAIDYVTLEINEDTAFDSLVVIENISKLVNTGVQLSLDDFNVSLGWISNVNKYRIKELKYRCSVKTKISSLKTVARLAKAMNVRLVVEQIPDTYRLDDLKLLDIETVQSYVTGMPEYALDLVS